MLSSAVLNGGLFEASHVLNLKVPKAVEHDQLPEDTLRETALGLGCEGAVVGLMTAASMDSTRIIRQTVEGVELVVVVTCGLENARRVGDTAEYRTLISPGQISHSQEVGTINIVFMTSVTLTAAAMVECVQMITEAKASALMTAGIQSPVSGLIATGTGTDAVVVVSGRRAETVSWCGKHVLFGELLGDMTLRAVADSISWYTGQSHQK